MVIRDNYPTFIVTKHLLLNLILHYENLDSHVRFGPNLGYKKKEPLGAAQSLKGV